MALIRINLRDFVIVSELTLEIAGGFTVLTGETGAGKSILVDALQLALGARADATTIREGASRAEVCAEFDCSGACQVWLQENGYDAADTLLLRRTIDAQGKSRAWINGSVATATQLREIGELLLDIHGQHAWQSLIRPSAVRGLLDAYARAETDTMARLWHGWRKSRTVLMEARAAQNSLQQERERLVWQMGELDKLAPGADEWDELNANHSRLSNAQALITAAESALECLEQDDVGALSRLSEGVSLLDAETHLESEFRAVAEVLRACVAQAEDAVHSLHAYLRRTSPDPERLAALDERMAQWVSLSRRYRRAPGELPELIATWRNELARLDAAADLAALESSEADASQAFLAEAQRVSILRHSAAPRLSAAVTAVMQALGMPGGRFAVVLEETASPTQSGMEEVAFLVAGHAGASPRPVSKVASGGELSRIALAIAVTTSQLGEAGTLIFDEVDAGVGGAVAETVGRLLKQIGRDHQVLAVTHLPQVASFGDHHLVVAKHAGTVGMVSSVTRVEGEKRVAEIARMLGGERLSATSIMHAREMLGASVPGAFRNAGASE